jgi:hypothetical protein
VNRYPVAYMRNLWCVLLSATIVLSGSAWSAEVPSTANAKVKKAKKCVFPKSKKRAPAWVCNPHADGIEVAAVGSAAKSKAGKSFMEQMAVADARAHLAQNLHESAQPKAEGSQDAANTSDSDSTVITKIANESLEDTKIIKRSYGPNGTLYVLIGIDEAGAQKLRDAVRLKTGAGE